MKTLLCSTAAIFIVSCANAEDYVYREAQPSTSQSVTYSNPTYYNEPSILNNIFGILVNHEINQTLHKNAPIGTVFCYGLTNNIKIGNVSVNYKLHEPGKCYANWETGGTDCYQMMKLIIGIILGVVLVTYHPQIVTTTKDFFVDSGIRDTIVNKLKEVK